MHRGLGSKSQRGWVLLQSIQHFDTFFTDVLILFCSWLPCKKPWELTEVTKMKLEHLLVVLTSLPLNLKMSFRLILEKIKGECLQALSRRHHWMRLSFWLCSWHLLCTRSWRMWRKLWQCGQPATLLMVLQVEWGFFFFNTFWEWASD